MRILFASLLLIASGAASASDAPVFVGAADCKILNSDAIARAQLSWSGACKDGFASGPGVLLWQVDGKPKARFDGELARGRYHGEGHMVFASGAEYEGSWRNGRQHGRGAALYANGDRYDGDWNNSCPDGQGTMAYTLGGRYDGQWQRCKRHGKGVLTFVGGEQLDVQFSEGVLPAGTPGASAGLVDDTAAPIIDRRPYAQLSDEEKQRIRRPYLLRNDSDEPPYPLNGTRDVYEWMHKAQRKVATTGALFANVLVNVDGSAAAVTMLATPDPELAKFATTILMKEKFKPGLCAGTPCKMTMPYRFVFKLRD